MNHDGDYDSAERGDGVKVPPFVSIAPAMARVAEALERAAATDVRVVLYGEPGVGKTHAAWRLHALSARRSGRFAQVSVREKSARMRLSDRGFLASVAGGTLVLEGVDEAPDDVQAFLVGMLEEWTAADAEGEAPVRVVATAQEDLLGLMGRGTFRTDLYFMIDVFPLAIPALRERMEEVPLFLDHFFRRHCSGLEPPRIPAEFLEAAMSHSWPGNLRELENVVLSSLPSRPGEPWQLPRALPVRGGQFGLHTFAEAKRDFELGYVRRLLTLTGGNVTRAAELAGKARKDFYALMARNHIDPAQFRAGDRKPQ